MKAEYPNQLDYIGVVSLGNLFTMIASEGVEGSSTPWTCLDWAEPGSAGENTCNELDWSSGYDVRLTRGRSPVQSWDEVFFAPPVGFANFVHMCLGTLRLGV